MKILIIDDDTTQLERFIAIAKNIKPSWKIEGLCNSSLAAGWILNEGYAGVICDTRMAPKSGVDIIYRVAEEKHEVPFLLHSNSSLHWQKHPRTRTQEKFVLPELAKKFSFVTFCQKEMEPGKTRTYFESFFETLPKK